MNKLLTTLRGALKRSTPSGSGIPDDRIVALWCAFMLSAAPLVESVTSHNSIMTVGTLVLFVFEFFVLLIGFRYFSHLRHSSRQDQRRRHSSRQLFLISAVGAVLLIGFVIFLLIHPL